MGLPFRVVLDLSLQEYLPADIQAQFLTSRELIKNIHSSFNRLRDRAEKMAERSKENAMDLLMFGRELRHVMGTVLADTQRSGPMATPSEQTFIHPAIMLFFLQHAGLRWFLSSILGLLSEHLGGPASVSEESVCGVRCAVRQSCSAGKPPHPP